MVAEAAVATTTISANSKAKREKEKKKSHRFCHMSDSYVCVGEFGVSLSENGEGSKGSVVVFFVLRMALRCVLCI